MEAHFIWSEEEEEQVEEGDAASPSSSLLVWGTLEEVAAAATPSLPQSPQIDGETMETVIDFIYLGSKITLDGDCSHEIKRHLFLRRKAMTKLDSILKSRGIALLTKICMVKAMVFPVVMYGCVPAGVGCPGPPRASPGVQRFGCGPVRRQGS